MPKGRYFLIKSFLNDKVLDIYEANPAPGTSVVMYSQNGTGSDNQLWTYHCHTHTIRSKLNGLCLDVKGDNVEMQPFGHRVQKWIFDGDLIKARDHPNKVLDIVKAKKDNGAKLCVYQHNGDDNQRWRREHPHPRYFYIKSRLNGKVLDISGGDRNRGAKVIMWDKGTGKDNQLWYEDEEGYIRSKLNDFVLDSSGDSVTMQPYHHHNRDQKWEIEKEFIMNHAKNDKVLDIRGDNKDAGADLCSYARHGGANQSWQFEHV